MNTAIAKRTKAIIEELNDIIANSTEDFKQDVKEHMKIQPYTIKCSECWEPLDVAYRNIDEDADLHIEVRPCVTCATIRDSQDQAML